MGKPERLGYGMRKKSRIKQQLLLWTAAAMLLQPMMFQLPAAASETVISEFSDHFEDYAHDGGMLYAKKWDNVKQGMAADSRVSIEHDGGNGFAAFYVKGGVENGQASYPSVAVRKNNINNQGRTLVYEGSFYTFDQNAKMTFAFTNRKTSELQEMFVLQGSGISTKTANGQFQAVSSAAETKKWNRIALALDGVAGTYRIYLNGQAVTDSVPASLGKMDIGALSMQISVKNPTGIAYAEGRIYMDDVYVYEAAAPVENTDSIISQTTDIKTYLNRQFTSVGEDSRAHGVASFTGAVNIVDTPSATNKSAKIMMGTDGAYFPLEQIAVENFNAKIIYQADRGVTLCAKDKTGKTENLVTVPARSSFGSVKVAFDMETGACTLTDETGKTHSAPLSLKNIMSIGFDGAGASLTLNKLFAYSGAEDVDDSYFKDYAYQKKARDILVTDTWKSNYDVLEQGVLMGIDFYQASVFGNKIRLSGQPPRVFDGKPYVPAEDTAVYLGGEVLEPSETAPVRMAVNGNTVEIGSEEIRREKDTNYISAQRIAAIFGLELAWDNEYLLGFGKKTLFNSAKEQDELKNALYFQRPTGAEIYDRIQKKGSLHPRVYVGAERFAEVRENIENNPSMQAWYDKIMKEAESYLDTYALYFERSDGVRLLAVSNTMVARMTALGIAYQMTGDAKYAEAAWRDLEAVSNFSDWNPSHYLDVTTMSHGVAIGYSWFYDWLSEDQKNIIVEGFIRCGLNSYIESLDMDDWWAHVNSNWNPWCHGGLMTAIVAMSDRLGERGMYALDRAFPYLEYLYPEFAPDGAWVEGISYHATTLNYLSEWCATMETATGKDFGYWDLPGMELTPYYGEALSGAGGVYNYGDNTEVVSNCAAQAWFAYKYHDNGLMQMRYSNILSRGLTTNWYDLLMLRPEMMNGSSSMANDMLYQDKNIVSLRTSWTDSLNGFFVGAKGGQNGESHFHYDLGGFVMDVGGVRFAYELGREGYTITQNDTETYQYKKRAEGHNTYVINPDETPGQGDTALAEVTEFMSKDKGSYAVIDLTQAYGEALDMKRGFMLTNDRQSLIIQDEVSLAGASEVYWFMHTAGDIEVAEDGKSVYITNSGVTIKMEMLESDDGGAKFEVRDPLPLDTTPWLEGQGRNERFKKLAIHWDNVQSYTLAIAVSQVIDRAVPTYTQEVVPISNWEIPDGEIVPLPKLTGITMNGMALQGFKPEQYTYSVNLPYDVEEKPVYAYTADSSLEVTVEESEKIIGNTKFIVHDKETGKYAVYVVSAHVNSYIGQIPGSKELNIAGVTASDEQAEEGNYAVGVLDNDYMTRWAAMYDAWLTVELEEPTEIYALGLSWYLGDQRSYIYDVEISMDGENWTQVYSGLSSGTTKDIESILLGNQKAKYVRYQGHGHSTGDWNNLSTVRVYGK